MAPLSISHPVRRRRARHHSRSTIRLLLASAFAASALAFLPAAANALKPVPLRGSALATIRFNCRRSFPHNEVLASDARARLLHIDRRYIACVRLGRHHDAARLLWQDYRDRYGTTDDASMVQLNGIFAGYLETSSNDGEANGASIAVCDLRTARCYDGDDGSLIDGFWLGEDGRSAWMDDSFYSNPNLPTQLRDYDRTGEHVVARSDELDPSEVTLVGLTLTWYTEAKHTRHLS